MLLDSLRSLTMNLRWQRTLYRKLTSRRKLIDLSKSFRLSQMTKPRLSKLSLRSSLNKSKRRKLLKKKRSRRVEICHRRQMRSSKS